MKTLTVLSIFLSSALSLPALGRRAGEDDSFFPIHNGTIPTPPNPIGTGAVKPTGVTTPSIPVPAPTGGAETGCTPGTYRCAQGSGMGEGWEVCQLGAWIWAGSCQGTQVCIFDEQNGSPYCVAPGTQLIGSGPQGLDGGEVPAEFEDDVDAIDAEIPESDVPDLENSDPADTGFDEGPSGSDITLPDIDVEVSEPEPSGDGTGEEDIEEEGIEGEGIEGENIEGENIKGEDGEDVENVEDEIIGENSE